MLKNQKQHRFLEKARGFWGETYNYDQVDYIDSHTKIKITCDTHGTFEQMPYVHLRGSGCPACGKLANRKIPTNS